jgi:hypothetical protein
MQILISNTEIFIFLRKKNKMGNHNTLKTRHTNSLCQLSIFLFTSYDLQLHSVNW